MQDSVVIVTPMYRQHLDEDERLSLQQLRRQLGHHRRVIIAPPGLSLGDFSDFEVVRFPPRFFRSVRGYNKLLLSRQFYRRFKQFQWMLIYQLDALVFRDELWQWCKAGYDFVGAPVFSAVDSTEVIGLNGGFSLRRTASCLRVLAGHLPLRVSSVSDGIIFMQRNVVFRLIKRFLLTLHFLGWANVLPLLIWRSGYNEDMIWSRYAPLINPDFTVAPFEVARTFSMEVQARRLFALNNGNLPFGCHAWEKWDPAFWRDQLRTLFQDAQR